MVARTAPPGGDRPRRYNTRMELSSGELVLRLALAVVLCGLIGLERESRDQVAGLRTHMLVGLGAALFTLISAYGFEAFDRPGPGGTGIRVDPTRIAAQIVSGIGFLGAGAIIREGFNVRGVTTAAALWIVAAIGMAAGAGYYAGAAATTALALAALVVVRRARPVLMRGLRSDVILLEVELRAGREIGEVIAALLARRIQVHGMRSEHGEDTHVFQLELRVPPDADLDRTLEELRRIEGVVRLSSEGGAGRWATG